MENPLLNTDNRRLVFGLGGGFCYSMGKDWRTHLPRLLQEFDNDVLISTVDMAGTVSKIIYDAVGQDRLYIDSGGFTLFKAEKKLGADNPEFHKECEKMKKKYLKLLAACPCKETFELDNEYFRVDEDLLSPRNYCREEVKAITGFYPTPVFKLHQGFEYWKALCDSDLYPRLAIGGLAQTRAWGTAGELLRDVMAYAREKGKKVHLLGCQNVEAFKAIQPSTVDYSIFQMAINMDAVKKEFPTLKEYRDMSPHMVLYAVARAMCRSFLYDSYQITEEE